MSTTTCPKTDRESDSQRNRRIWKQVQDRKALYKALWLYLIPMGSGILILYSQMNFLLAILAFFVLWNVFPGSMAMNSRDTDMEGHPRRFVFYQWIFCIPFLLGPVLEITWNSGQMPKYALLAISLLCLTEIIRMDYRPWKKTELQS